MNSTKPPSQPELRPATGLGRDRTGRRARNAREDRGKENSENQHDRAERLPNEQHNGEHNYQARNGNGRVQQNHHEPISAAPEVTGGQAKRCTKNDRDRSGADCNNQGNTRPMNADREDVFAEARRPEGIRPPRGEQPAGRVDLRRIQGQPRRENRAEQKTEYPSQRRPESEPPTTPTILWTQDATRRTRSLGSSNV